jgi:starch-binding outer membrane protein, SusD/RagB family
MTHRHTQRGEGGVRHGPRLLGIFALTGALALTGCDSLLDVSNPNNVAQEDVEQPQAATAMVNGAAARSALAWAFVARMDVTVSDEVRQSGSWDAARDMNNGNMQDPGNADVNDGFNTASVGRWMADEALALVRRHNEEGTLARPADLTDAHLYSGLGRLLVASYFEDFVFSNRTEAGAPIGPDNMVQVFDQAAERFTQMRTLAQAQNDRERERQAVALLARTHWARALHQKLLPRGQTPSDPLVNSTQANQYAEAFFQLGPDADWRFSHQYSPDSNQNTLSQWVNSRREIVPAPEWAEVDAGLNIGATTRLDPVDNVPAPALTRRISEVVVGNNWAPLPIVSAREMHLILAEAALAAGNTEGFQSRINTVRALDEGLSPYTGQVPAVEMLAHTRSVNMYLQGRRLADQYRFGIQSPRWLPGSDAVNRPGSFFPIGLEERQTNCHFVGGC